MPTFCGHGMENGIYPNNEIKSVNRVSNFNSIILIFIQALTYVLKHKNIHI